MEYLDVYDKDRRLTGRVKPRNAPVEEDDRFLIVHIGIFNSRGEMLIQRRHEKKDRYPGCWDVSAGGFADAGESSLTAVLREAREELGLELTAQQLCLVLCVPFKWVFDDFYIALCEPDIAGLNFQRDEISALRWISREELLPMIDSGEFVDYDADIIEAMYKAAGEGRA